MDPLTHSFAGAALARTRLGGGTRLATTCLVLGANLPDVDVLSFVAGPDAALGFRRGWTHGPLGVVLLPALLAGVLVAVDRRRRFSKLFGLALLASVTHPLLDGLNTYGVRWLMPFDDRWYYGDAVFIVDPWLWLILGGAAFLASDRRGFPPLWTVLALSTSLVVLGSTSYVPAGARIAWIAGLSAVALLARLRAVRDRPRAAAVAGLTLAAVYIGLAIASSAATSGIVRAELERRGVTDVHRLMVAPRPANPFGWEVVAETSDVYRHGAFRWLPRPKLLLSPTSIEKAAPSAVLEAARAAPEVQGALRWMRFPFAKIEETSDGYTVYLLDARYRRLPGRGFGAAVVELDRNLRPRPSTSFR